eukprot:GHVL01008373.1.p1 GENE.GHVL01008373.1~~GHVL01008373.1.p1  ORF type:complete len:1305 (+),score=204.68 GHVL01008373.1:115-4029(+)
MLANGQQHFKKAIGDVGVFSKHGKVDSAFYECNFHSYPEKIQFFGKSRLISQKLSCLREFIDCAHEVGFNKCVSSLIPIFAKLAKDQESEVRLNVTKLFGDVAGFLIQSEPEYGYQKVIELLFPLVKDLLMDHEESVRCCACECVLVLASHLRRDERGEVVLPLILYFAHHTEDEVNRCLGAYLLNILSEALGVDLCRQFVASEILSLSQDSKFRVRRAVVMNCSQVCKMLGEEFTVSRMLDTICALAQDSSWRVRRGAAETLHTFSLCVDMITRQTILVNLVINLIKDSSQWVRFMALRTVGAFLTTLQPEFVKTHPRGRFLLSAFIGLAAPIDACNNEFALLMRTNPSFLQSSSSKDVLPWAADALRITGISYADFDLECSEDKIGLFSSISNEECMREINKSAAAVCAYYFSSVAITLGADGWNDLSGPLAVLAGHPSSCVRKPLAASFPTILSSFLPQSSNKQDQGEFDEMTVNMSTDCLPGDETMSQSDILILDNKMQRDNVLENNVLEENVLENNVLEDNVLEDKVLEDNVLENKIQLIEENTSHVNTEYESVDKTTMIDEFKSPNEPIIEDIDNSTLKESDLTINCEDLSNMNTVSNSETSDCIDSDSPKNILCKSMEMSDEPSELNSQDGIIDVNWAILSSNDNTQKDAQQMDLIAKSIHQDGEIDGEIDKSDQNGEIEKTDSENALSEDGTNECTNDALNSIKDKIDHHDCQLDDKDEKCEITNNNSENTTVKRESRDCQPESEVLSSVGSSGDKQNGSGDSSSCPKESKEQIDSCRGTEDTSSAQGDSETTVCGPMSSRTEFSTVTERACPPNNPLAHEKNPATYKLDSMLMQFLHDDSQEIAALTLSRLSCSLSFLPHRTRVKVLRILLMNFTYSSRLLADHHIKMEDEWIYSESLNDRRDNRCDWNEPEDSLRSAIWRETNWRCRRYIASQLSGLIELFDPKCHSEVVSATLVPIMLYSCKHFAAAVSQAAITCLPVLLRHACPTVWHICSQNGSLETLLRKRKTDDDENSIESEMLLDPLGFIEECPHGQLGCIAVIIHSLAFSHNYNHRVLFVRACDLVIRHTPRSLFVYFFMKPLMALAAQPVIHSPWILGMETHLRPGGRLRNFSQMIKTARFIDASFKGGSEAKEKLLSLMETLKNSDDRVKSSYITCPDKTIAQYLPPHTPEYCLPDTPTKGSTPTPPCLSFFPPLTSQSIDPKEFEAVMPGSMENILPSETTSLDITPTRSPSVAGRAVSTFMGAMGTVFEAVTRRGGESPRQDSFRTRSQSEQLHRLPPDIVTRSAEAPAISSK